MTEYWYRKIDVHSVRPAIRKAVMSGIEYAKKDLGLDTLIPVFIEQCTKGEAMTGRSNREALKIRYDPYFSEGTDIAGQISTSCDHEVRIRADVPATRALQAVLHEASHIALLRKYKTLVHHDRPGLEELAQDYVQAHLEKAKAFVLAHN